MAKVVAMSKDAESILTEALKVTGGDRQENYGHPLANHVRIAELWNGYLVAKSVTPDGSRDNRISMLTPSDVAAMMVLLKIARNMHKPKRDNLTDAAGYCRCLSRIQGFEP
jgi:hypothetical protein